MRGWVADIFRLVWGLLYWNGRKSWFRLRRGRSVCPCQCLSDSGRAFETQCEACVGWHRPARFRRVCPLLVETPDGLRCSVDTADVRPFWGRTAGYFGGAALTVYLIGALTVFTFLRTVGYPISIVHVTWPGLWYRVPQARGWFFLERSRRAFAAGKTAEGLLYLANAYEFDPNNYAAGIALAKNYQAGQPERSDQVFENLMRRHPEKRDATAQDWYRALLARGDFVKSAALARDEIRLDAAHAHVWVRALLFATRHSGDDAPLRELLADESPAAVVWQPLLETELRIRDGRRSEARAALDRTWAENVPPATRAYLLVYRVDALIRLGDPLAALDLLERSVWLQDDEARVTLRLDALATLNATGPLQREFDALLAPRTDLWRLKILCAQLIRHPDAAVFARVCQTVERDGLPLNTETAGAWFSLLCTAGAVGDTTRLGELTLRLKTASSTPFVALALVEAFFRGQIPDRRITTFLPLLPLPLEITYALIDRYETTPAAAGTPASAPRKSA